VRSGLGREKDFKNGKLDALVCTPTLELGVDIGPLLTVVLRNAPPTPANYAQRVGVQVVGYGLGLSPPSAPAKP
jgi:Lhr-like helicase